jgi:hypothetical protein
MLSEQAPDRLCESCHGRKKLGDVQKSLLESYVVTFLAFNIGDHFSSWNDPTIGGNQRFEQTRTEQSH